MISAVGPAILGCLVIGAHDLARAADESRAVAPTTRLGPRTVKPAPVARNYGGGRHKRK